MPGRFDRARVEDILGGDPLLTRDEAAERLGLDVSQVDRLAAAGEIPSISPGGRGPRSRRFRASAIDRACKERGITP